MKEQISETEERKKLARNVFQEFPDMISVAIQEKILEGRVVLGMTPYEASLTAGAFFFQVQADERKWSNGANPYDVMWAQSLHPDESEIWMTFKTDTQYPGEGLMQFKVYFKGGKALTINKL